MGVGLDRNDIRLWQRVSAMLGLFTRTGCFDAESDVALEESTVTDSWAFLVSANIDSYAGPVQHNYYADD